MIQINAIGDACPLPVVKTVNAIRELKGPETVETLVDNDIAVQNIQRLAESKGYGFSVEKQEGNRFRVLLSIDGGAEVPEETAECYVPMHRKNTVVAVSSRCMGMGDDELGAVLMKNFIYALAQTEELPQTILFYNGGAFLSCEDSPTLDDLREMEARGVEILTCGACLTHYGLKEKLGVGGITNMYSIVEKLTGADLIVKP